MAESPTAAALKKLLLSLGFPRPPDTITATQLWEKVSAKVMEVAGKAAPELLGKPLLTKAWLHILCNLKPFYFSKSKEKLLNNQLTIGKNIKLLAGSDLGAVGSPGEDCGGSGR